MQTVARSERKVSSQQATPNSGNLTSKSLSNSCTSTSRQYGQAVDQFVTPTSRGHEVPLDQSRSPLWQHLSDTTLSSPKICHLVCNILYFGL